MLNFSCYRWLPDRNGVPMTLYYSTSPVLNQLVDNVRIPVFQTAEIDANHDGLPDRLEASMQLPIAQNETMLGVTALFLHDITLQQRGRYKFDAASYVQYSSAIPIDTLTIDGDLKFKQTWPLVVGGGYVLHSHCPYVQSSITSSRRARTLQVCINLSFICLMYFVGSMCHMIRTHCWS